MRRQRILVKAASAASAAQSKRAQKLPVFAYKGDKEELSTLLLELEVDGNDTVVALKEKLAAAFTAESTEGYVARML